MRVQKMNQASVEILMEEFYNSAINRFLQALITDVTEIKDKAISDRGKRMIELEERMQELHSTCQILNIQVGYLTKQHVRTVVAGMYPELPRFAKRYTVNSLDSLLNVVFGTVSESHQRTLTKYLANRLAKTQNLVDLAYAFGLDDWKSKSLEADLFGTRTWSSSGKILTVRLGIIKTIPLRESERVGGSSQLEKLFFLIGAVCLHLERNCEEVRCEGTVYVPRNRAVELKRPHQSPWAWNKKQPKPEIRLHRI